MIAYCVKGRRETGRGKGGWKILCPPGSRERKASTNGSGKPGLSRFGWVGLPG